MKFYINVSVYCPKASVERQVLCYQNLLDGLRCGGCKDVDDSEHCKKCLDEVTQKLTPEDFA